MSLIQKIDLLRDFVAGVYLSVAQNPIPSLTHCIRVNSILIHTGKGRGVEPERRLEGQQFTKLDRKYQHDRQYLQSINTDKHLPQSPFTGQFL
jgi:hypothetical protein